MFVRPVKYNRPTHTWIVTAKKGPPPPFLRTTGFQILSRGRRSITPRRANKILNNFLDQFPLYGLPNKINITTRHYSSLYGKLLPNLLSPFTRIQNSRELNRYAHFVVRCFLRSKFQEVKVGSFLSPQIGSVGFMRCSIASWLIGFFEAPKDFRWNRSVLSPLQIICCLSINCRGQEPASRAFCQYTAVAYNIFILRIYLGWSRFSCTSPRDSNRLPEHFFCVNFTLRRSKIKIIPSTFRYVRLWSNAKINLAIAVPMGGPSARATAIGPFFHVSIPTAANGEAYYSKLAAAAVSANKRLTENRLNCVFIYCFKHFVHSFPGAYVAHSAVIIGTQ